MGDFLTPGSILGIIGIIATGVCTVLVIDRKTMREGMDDLRARRDDVANERDDLLRKNAELLGVVHQCKTDLDALSRVVTGEAHWVVIEQLIRELIDRFSKVADKIDATLGSEDK